MVTVTWGSLTGRSVQDEGFTNTRVASRVLSQKIPRAQNQHGHDANREERKKNRFVKKRAPVCVTPLGQLTNGGNGSPPQ